MIAIYFLYLLNAQYAYILFFSLSLIGLLFGQFAVIAAAAVWFTTQYVFETQGLSLEEIETKLKTVVDGE